MAERICKLAARDRYWDINYDLVGKEINFNEPLVSWPLEVPGPKANEAWPPKSGGISFVEIMRGYFSTEVTTKDYRAAEGECKFRNCGSRTTILLL